MKKKYIQWFLSENQLNQSTSVVSIKINIDSQSIKSTLHSIDLRPKRFDIPFGPRDIVYVKEKAEKGYLQRIVIKYSKIPFTTNVAIPLYIDTLNELWNHNELVSYEDALEIINKQIPDTNDVTLLIPSFQLTGTLLPPNTSQYKNEIRYLKDRALKGKIESVYIKNTKKNIYEDTLNRIWNKTDLIDFESARTLALKYLNEKKEKLEVN